jgi:hypothetical protein
MWGFQVSRQLRSLPGLCRCSREVDTPKMEGTMMTCPWLLHLCPQLIGGSTAKRGSQTSLCGWPFQALAPQIGSRTRVLAWPTVLLRVGIRFAVHSRGCPVC